VGNPGDNLGAPLWIASYTQSPRIPAAWPSGWSFWQYSSTGSVPGISGNVDTDYFQGTRDALLALCYP
jgi:GH25 family lysozyme M1 (1,4-beta-N-acetylmuramidase)